MKIIMLMLLELCIISLLFHVSSSAITQIWGLAWFLRLNIQLENQIEILHEAHYLLLITVPIFIVYCVP